jgi:hypothetical protein
VESTVGRAGGVLKFMLTRTAENSVKRKSNFGEFTMDELQAL